MSYLIKDHQHRFAAWTASRAASVKGCRFSVQQGRRILEDVGLHKLLGNPSALPRAVSVDAFHRRWRKRAIRSAALQGLTFTHGVAAKLINVYLKSAFVCGGHDAHPNVCALHPPIDAGLLKGLLEQNAGGLAARWRAHARIRWSNFGSDTYEAVISDIRTVVKERPLWTVEEFWPGYQ